MTDENQQRMTEFDTLVSPEPVQIMKAMIPYTPPRGQRILSIYTKVMELQNTMNVFRQSRPDLSICASTPEKAAASSLEMINDIRSYCSPTMQKRIDECMNMMAMIQVMEVFQDSGN